MKRCPRCGTVSGDTDLACGVCGAAIADIPSESLEEATREHNVDVLRKAEKERKELRKIDKRRVERIVSESGLGLGGMVGGLSLFVEYGNLFGIFVILLWMLLLIHVLFCSLVCMTWLFASGGL